MVLVSGSYNRNPKYIYIANHNPTLTTNLTPTLNLSRPWHSTKSTYNLNANANHNHIPKHNILNQTPSK